MIAVAFPGQGAQYVGMAGELDQMRLEYFARASDLLGYDLLELCQKGPIEQLSNTRYAQPAIMVACISHWAALTQNVRPDVLLGHSLGELTALVAAGAVGFDDGVLIAAKRGELMDVYGGEGRMAAVLGPDLDAVEAIVEQASGHGTIVVANYNSPSQFVLAGTDQAVEQAEKLALERGAKRVVKLRVSGPFHSPLMQEAAEQFACYLQSIVFADPMIPVISNVNSGLITRGDQVKMELVNQIASPVRWIDNIKAAERMGVRRLIEVGPGNVLINLAKRITKDMELVSFP